MHSLSASCHGCIIRSVGKLLALQRTNTVHKNVYLKIKNKVLYCVLKLVNRVTFKDGVHQSKHVFFNEINPYPANVENMVSS
jgi:hypothetical protein